jgi:sugar/nucleoside kinase (ribokinase family)
VLIDNRFPDFVLPIARAARARGLPLVIDADRATTPDDALLALGTHVIASAEALTGTTGTRDPAAGLATLAAHAQGFLAVTGGPRGVWWREGETLRHMPAFPVAAVDTLGAGDVFHGAFTLALAERRDAVTALRFATATAALKCTRFGGGAGAPTRAEVEALLR